MRHKLSIEDKLDRLESISKKIGFYIRRRENDEAYDRIADLLDVILSIRTLLNGEKQD